MNAEQKNTNDLAGLSRLFLKLGCIGFGGPAAHISMMKDEVVNKRKWMSEQHFLDLVGATNLIPGPNSTELAIHIGREKAGWKGLIVAGSCFILPAVLITGIIAWLYKLYGELPQVQSFIYGIKPAIIPIILTAVLPLARTSLKTVYLGIIGLLALALSLIGVNEIFILFGAGLFTLLIRGFKKNINGLVPVPILQLSVTALTSAMNVNLFLSFLKIGSILYGSGYVLFAFMDTELVATGLLSRQQLIDAIATGQFTPGPVFSAVTFAGYQINGFSGALVSTIGVFLPSFLFVALLNPLVRKMRSSLLFGAFLDAVNIASVAVIIVVCYELGKDSIIDWRTTLIAVASGAILLRYKNINSAWIVLGGAVMGYLLTLIK